MTTALAVFLAAGALLVLAGTVQVRAADVSQGGTPRDRGNGSQRAGAGRARLEIYVMCEIPSNVTLAKEFAEVFDGFSIGSNDLTQLVLGVDRDSELVAHLFDERNEAVTRTIAQVIGAVHAAARKIGICGQAPSDYPEFAQFVVTEGIDSLSVNRFPAQDDARDCGCREALAQTTSETARDVAQVPRAHGTGMAREAVASRTTQ